ncbi:MAG TPA: protein-tyrosine phosphatase family protein, partial [Myxococcota bacterium]|nr:protein-tyrosine phosphatase family protein [Myxococcota bacterium]
RTDSRTVTVPTTYEVTHPRDPKQSVRVTTSRLQLMRYELQHRGARRALTVLDYDGWPDFAAVPPQTLALLCEAVDAARGTGPLAVHCAGGTGRTGTFILAHALSQAPDLTPKTAPPVALSLLMGLRLQRAGAVETSAQWRAALESAGLPLPQGSTLTRALERFGGCFTSA